MVPEVSLAYLAGFFDGEGCISCTATGRWTVAAVQAEKNSLVPLQEMKRRWGGTLYRRGTPKSDKHSAVWGWHVCGLQAAIALLDMYPYLINKKERAVDAIADLRKRPRIERILSRIGPAQD